ncbi:MAG: hypothetical protein AAF629_30220 [Chloroflexota bacterium]
MNDQSHSVKGSDGDKENMVTTSFRLPAVALEAVKRKLGPFGVPSKIFRVLVGMWLDGKIEVTEEDVKKYGD